MEWVPHDEPTVQKQRGKWTVRQGGYDPSTGRRKVRQLGTFDTKRAATELAKSVAAGRAGSADETVEAFVVDVWLRSKEGRVEQSRSTSTGGPSTVTSSRSSVRSGSVT